MENSFRRLPFVPLETTLCWTSSEETCTNNISIKLKPTKSHNFLSNNFEFHLLQFILSVSSKNILLSLLEIKWYSFELHLLICKGDKCPISKEKGLLDTGASRTLLTNSEWTLMTKPRTYSFIFYNLSYLSPQRIIHRVCSKWDGTILDYIFAHCKKDKRSFLNLSILLSWSFKKGTWY